MRTWFAPEEAKEFEAVKAVLLRRCLAWADEHGQPADAVLIAAALDSRHHSRDGRLCYWDTDQIRRFLLCWLPKYVVGPKETLEIAPETLRTYLRYLTATGLRDPRGTAPTEADQAIVQLTPEFQRTINDPGLLAGLLEARFIGPDPAPEEIRVRPHAPIALPPLADLAEAAPHSTTLQRLITLTTWVGGGRLLIKVGRLPLSAARELSALLGTGEESRHAYTSLELPTLSLLLTLATKLGLIRYTRDRLIATADPARLRQNPETLWRRTFATLQTLTTPAFLTTVLDTLYGMDDLPVAHLEEALSLQVCDNVLPEAQDHVARVLEVLSDMGAIDLTHAPANPFYLDTLDQENHPLPADSRSRLRLRLSGSDLPHVRLTPLALRSVRRRLLSEGYDAPLLGELSTSPPAELLGVLSQHYSPQEAITELNAWLSHPGQDIESLLRAIRSSPFRSRAAAMLAVLADALPQGNALLRELRDDPILGPTALTLLMDEGEIDPLALGQREHLLLGAESFLTVLEVGGPEALIEQLQALAGRDAYHFAEKVLASGHHDYEGLEEMRDLVADPLRDAYNRSQPLVPSTTPSQRNDRGREP